MLNEAMFAAYFDELQKIAGSSTGKMMEQIVKKSPVIGRALLGVTRKGRRRNAVRFLRGLRKGKAWTWPIHGAAGSKGPAGRRATARTLRDALASQGKETPRRAAVVMGGPNRIQQAAKGAVGVSAVVSAKKLYDRMKKRKD